LSAVLLKKREEVSKMNKFVLFIGNGISHQVREALGCPVIEITAKEDLEKIRKQDVPNCVIIDGEVKNICVELVMEYIGGIRPGTERIILSDNFSVKAMGAKRHLKVFPRHNLDRLKKYFERRL
jgi:hypothetical protein